MGRCLGFEIGKYKRKRRTNTLKKRGLCKMSRKVVVKYAGGHAFGIQEFSPPTRLFFHIWATGSGGGV